jgi:hypothetical protein
MLCSNTVARSSSTLDVQTVSTKTGHLRVHAHRDGHRPAADEGLNIGQMYTVRTMVPSGEAKISKGACTTEMIDWSCVHCDRHSYVLLPNQPATPMRFAQMSNRAIVQISNSVNKRYTKNG